MSYQQEVPNLSSFEDIVRWLSTQPVIHFYKPWIKKYNTTRSAILTYLAMHGETSVDELIDALILTRSKLRANTKFLINKGAIKEVPANPYEIKNKICRKTPQAGIGNATCEWCHGKTLYLHGHHFPKLESEGGKDIVNICPNCHMEFHYLHRKTFLKITLDIPEDLMEVQV